ncbi:hypothetical protein [Phaeodactylibacter luteus]|uniref:Uncharacterized protein n=1 Tax=Phaeodactylibacter luteus TaxID=1564516 RepID=A0A5C6RMY9_9BACT|nr:hypothetical protein [Phaeodactylibacter luteus]TXB63567.1 hypothetical protein FRY97_08560 [Phaeodactylibacter luteus]
MNRFIIHLKPWAYASGRKLFSLMKSSFTSALRSISAGIIWASFALLLYFAFGANDEDKPTALTASAGMEMEVVDLGCGEE